jgi:prepilin-type processing-associated H-X9-DG protein
MTKEDKGPKAIDDKELDEASGGLLPAAQKLEDTTSTESSSSSHSGGVNMVMGDGSVRFVR